MSTTFTKQQATEQNEDELAFYFVMEGDNSEQEDQLWSMVQEVKEPLTRELSALTGALLGPRCFLGGIDVTRGSVTLWIFVGGAYTIISQYSDFVKSVREFTLHVQRLLKSMFGTKIRGFSVMSGYAAAAALRPNRAKTNIVPRDFITLLLVSYLVVSHAALLVVLFRFLFRTTAAH